MQEYLKKVIENYPRKFINSRELETAVITLMGERAWERGGAYASFAGVVKQLVGDAVLSPVKASGSNGRVPPLAVKYRLERRNASTSSEIFSFQSAIDLSYFHRHNAELQHYYEILQSIDRYLVETAGKEPRVWDTVNERSFALTGDEKFLSSAAGTKLLSRINVSLDALHCYKVAEPFFYRQLSGGGDTVSRDLIYGLIIENKDTFETFSSLQQSGYLRLSPPLDLIIYGEGNKITGSWSFLDSIPWICDKKATLFYFGDLDPEGINIYCRLLSAVDKCNLDPGGAAVKVIPEIKLAESLYYLMLRQGMGRVLEKQITQFDMGNLKIACANFPPDLREGIISLWTAGHMIPQEALSASRMAEIGEVEL